MPSVPLPFWIAVPRPFQLFPASPPLFLGFLGVREHDLPTFTVPIRIVVSTPFHRFPADSPPDSGFLGVREHDLPTFPVPMRIDVSTPFHWFLPVLTRLYSIPHVSAPPAPTLPASPSVSR